MIITNIIYQKKDDKRPDEYERNDIQFFANVSAYIVHLKRIKEHHRGQVAGKRTKKIKFEKKTHNEGLHLIQSKKSVHWMKRYFEPVSFKMKIAIRLLLTILCEVYRGSCSESLSILVLLFGSLFSLSIKQQIPKWNTV